jgi:Co/Zn/Cd efflux system component
MAHHHADCSSQTHEHARHSHLHGIVEPTIVTTARGMRAVKWSCVALLVTACVQLMVVALSGSVAFLADTVHNFGDAATAPPVMGRLSPGPTKAHRAVHLRLGPL